MAGSPQPAPPPRRPTMKDVAARAGVSRALVSIVFRELPGAGEESRRRVRAAADQLGYQLDQRARLLRRQHSRLVGVTFSVAHEFHADLVDQLYAAARERDYELTLSGVTRSRDQRVATQDLLALRCDALILLGPSGRAADLMTTTATTPIVVVARALNAPDLSVVRTDDVTGAALATQHLIDLGHRNIVHVDGGRAPGTAERRRGYRRCMVRAGLGDNITVVSGGLSDADGGGAARHVLKDLPGTTAAVVFNDQAAFGFLATARAEGIRVPQDFSITGYDNTKISRTDWARLTTVGQPASTIAQAAVDEAIGRIQQGPTRQILVEPELIVRDTTSPPSA